jgi:hypothetical protein
MLDGSAYVSIRDSTRQHTSAFATLATTCTVLDESSLSCAAMLEGSWNGCALPAPDAPASPPPAPTLIALRLTSASEFFSAMRVKQPEVPRYFTCIRQHTSAYVRVKQPEVPRYVTCIRQHTSAYVSIRQHIFSALRVKQPEVPRYVTCIRQHTSAYVSIRQHT